MIDDFLIRLLESSDIMVGGNRPYDLQINDKRFYNTVLSLGSLALGESYMKGWWQCLDLEEFLYRLIKVGASDKVKANPKIAWYYLKSRLFNMQTRISSLDVAYKHYNVGNELYVHMLDKNMIYSCGYWKNADTLDEAQEAKLDLICRKLKLVPGQVILDIGCGWGGFAKFAALHYAVKVVGISISQEQVHFAKNWCKGLNVDIRLQDYRDVRGRFDRIVSVGMFEHVGYKNYQTFMKIVNESLESNGIFLLHCIGGNESATATDPWIDRYIFPHGLMPSPKQLIKAIEPYFILEDWHNFGLDYDKTLKAWLMNFRASWNKIKENYDDVFFRMWEYYLSISAASFKAKYNNVWQLVLTKKGNGIEYISER